jgi:hypothetical protein
MCPDCESYLDGFSWALILRCHFTQAPTLWSSVPALVKAVLDGKRLVYSFALLLGLPKTSNVSDRYMARLKIDVAYRRLQ